MPLGTPLGLVQWKMASSGLKMRTSGFLSISDLQRRVSAELEQGSQALSRVEAKNSALLSSYDGYLLEPIDWPKVSQASCGF